MSTPSKRSPPLVRWVRTIVRSLHIPAIGLVLGAWWLGDMRAAQGTVMVAAALTGLGLGVLFFWQSRLWLLEVRGAVVIAKVAALSALPYLGHTAGLWLLLAVAFIASVASHMPGNWRHMRLDQALRRR